ncbi:hypothetical protein C5C07_19205 [Haloferax sp. Atlit-4N]|nr:hypothetical protein C5C07_19205 [Haloferax sp. Atlit-4N]
MRETDLFERNNIRLVTREVSVVFQLCEAVNDQLTDSLIKCFPLFNVIKTMQKIIWQSLL